MNITLIGSGNVANYLAGRLFDSSHNIKEVYSRNKKTGAALSKKYSCEFVNHINKLSEDSDIFIIAVNDDEIENVAKQLRIKKGSLFHMSGSTGIKVLQKTAKNFGVLYPLISIDKSGKFVPNEFPVCVEANNEKALKLAKKLAKLLGNKVISVDSKTREILHLSAVMVNNFSNHLYTLADELLEDNNLNLKLLHPIIIQTAERIKKEKPTNLQTGPAIRNDKKVINKQLQIIKNNKALYSLYKSFTKSIFESGK